MISPHKNYPLLEPQRNRFYLDRISQYAHNHNMEPGDLCVLDLGCGIGRLSRLIAEAGYQVLAVDQGKESLEYLRASNPPPTLKLKELDLETSPWGKLDPEPFHVVIASAVFEHLHNPLDTLQQIAEKIVPEGLLLGEVPNGYGASEISHAIRRKLSKRWGHTSWYKASSNRLRYKKEEEAEATLSLTDTPHIQSFTARSLSRMLLEADFQIEEIINANLLQGVPVLHKLLLKIPALQRLDLATAPHLPKFLGNGWYFSARYRLSEE